MKMLTKEEYEKALSKLWDNTFGTDCITGEDLDKYVDIIDGLIQYVFNPQPYKFEYLHKGMWVWDDKSKCYFKCNPAISTDMAQCVTYNAFWYNCGEDEDEFFEEYDEFEEGRFFPPTKAMEYQE